jgi:hypothetical protein
MSNRHRGWFVGGAVGVLVAELGGEFAAGVDAEFSVDPGEMELDGLDG